MKKVLKSLAMVCNPNYLVQAIHSMVMNFGHVAVQSIADNKKTVTMVTLTKVLFSVHAALMVFC